MRKNHYILFLFLVLQVHAEALGYVGFGVSPNGGMTGADVVIGWVSDIDGTAVFHVRIELNYIKDHHKIPVLKCFKCLVHLHVSFQDRHALGEYEPVIDESQDVTLLAANQNDTHTILRFSRPYVTCDENDMDITVNINLYNVYLQFKFF